jgi:hypothetical protein
LACDRLDPLYPWPTLPILRLERRSHRRQTGYLDSLATQRFPAVLEMEIGTSWASVRTCRHSEIDRRHGPNSNPTWGEQRIADELLLKIGIQISPRTVRRYMPNNPKRPADPSQQWMTFVRNHAKAVIACDFFVVVTATFQLVYAFVVMEIRTRRVVHFNVTQHPTAEWTLQQFRECVTGEEGYRFIIHDRDRIYSCSFDQPLKSLGLTVLKTPYKSPQATHSANA